MVGSLWLMCAVRPAWLAWLWGHAVSAQISMGVLLLGHALSAQNSMGAHAAVDASSKGRDSWFHSLQGLIKADNFMCVC
jgi:hypothetical protein